MAPVARHSSASHWRTAYPLIWSPSGPTSHRPWKSGSASSATNTTKKALAVSVGRLGSYTHVLLGTSRDEQHGERRGDLGDGQEDAGGHAQPHRPARAEGRREQADEDNLSHPHPARRE